MGNQRKKFKRFIGGYNPGYYILLHGTNNMILIKIIEHPPSTK
jgi:hypothetical protein